MIARIPYYLLPLFNINDIIKRATEEVVQCRDFIKISNLPIKLLIMKKTTLLLITILTTLSMYGQDITGQWNGILNIQGTQLRLVFNISQADNGYSSTMDSPDQGAKGIPVTLTSYENSILILEISNAGIQYEGTLDK